MVAATVNSVSELIKIRRKAMRLRTWFKVLDGTERAIVILTIRCVERVKSPKLAKIVMAIVTKLTNAMKGQMERLIDTFGRPLAQKLSRVAMAWGNRSAALWAEDLGFIQYLVTIQMNMPRTFQT